MSTRTTEPGARAAGATSRMKAIVQTAYGDASALSLTQIARPVPGADQVLVRVLAASLHAGDIVMLHGNPYPARFLAGWPTPREGYVPGSSVAGIVEEVGATVTSLRPGDPVFGECKGALAEFALGTEETLVAKPSKVTFAEAAAIPTSALAAHHGLRHAANVQPGQRVLINGASGGVGIYAVQIAKALGATVTGVCSTPNVEMVRRLGADSVVDYKGHDFTTGTDTYDLIFDTVGNHSFSQLRRVLAPTGVVLPVGKASVASMLSGMIRSLFTAQKDVRFLSVPNRQDLLSLAELVGAGTLTTVIDRQYPLEETAEAMTYVAGRHVKGKVVVMPSTESR